MTTATRFPTEEDMLRDAIREGAERGESEALLGILRATLHTRVAARLQASLPAAQPSRPRETDRFEALLARKVPAARRDDVRAAVGEDRQARGMQIRVLLHAPDRVAHPGEFARQLAVFEDLLIRKLASRLHIEARRRVGRDLAKLEYAIGALVNLPDLPGPTPAWALLEPGLYQKNGIVFKVWRAKTGRLRASRFDEETCTYVLTPGAVRTLAPENRMSVEEATARSIALGRCYVCHKELRVSAHLGIGPKCAQKV